MSDAHDKTRVRQLEDAAAYWDHKYVKARQYSRNLEARIAEIEADRDGLREALVGFVAYMDSDDDGGEGVFEEHMERFAAAFRLALHPPSGEK